MRPRLDPPTPPPGTAAWKLALLAVLAMTLAVLRYSRLGLLLSPLAALALLLRRRPLTRRGAPPPLLIPSDLDQTAPARVFADGSAACCGCDAVVPFDSMSINEDGYFCPGCARR